MAPPDPARAGSRPGLLDGLVAVELADAGGQLCGRILADLGARVVKVEPPGGDPARRMPPLHGGTSVAFAHLNAGKQSVVLDLASPAGRAELAGLVAAADVVLTTWQDADLAGIGLDPARLAREHPELVVTSLTGFGRSGPYAGHRCPDIVGMAMGGLMFISGEADQAPVRGPETQAHYFASIYAAQGTVAALRRRSAGGCGAVVEVSVYEAMATTDQLVRMYHTDGTVMRRRGSQHGQVVPARIFATSDGFVSLFVGESHWPRFLELWAGHPAVLDAPRMRSVPARMAAAELVNGHVQDWVAGFTTEEFQKLMAGRGVPCAAVNTLPDFLAEEQTVARELLGPVIHPGLPAGRQVRLPMTVDGERPPARPAPAPGEHDPVPGRGAGPVRARGSAPVARAMEGVRVVAFTRGLAGPLAGRYLAEAGADVVKVESMHGGIDSFRQFSTNQDIDSSPRFLEYNLGVRSVRLNLREETGVRLARELVGTADVVLDNFRPGVLDRLGLGAEALRAEHPRLIVVQSPGFGSTGPRRTEGSWGPNVMAYVGATHLWNHPGAAVPAGTQSAYPDYLAGAFVPLAVAAALVSRERTGRGAVLDVAQTELMAYLLGVTALEYSLTGVDPAPVGNAAAHAAPHGCYPCAGEDRWCVVAVEEDAQWRALVEVMGRPELAGHPDYATTGVRLARRDAIDALVVAHTRGRDAREVMAELQAAGVPCGVVQDARDLATDPHLAARGALVEIAHPAVATTTVPRLPVRMSGGGLQRPARSPLMGEHDEDVICGLLGHSADELREWQGCGVVA